MDRKTVGQIPRIAALGKISYVQPYNIPYFMTSSDLSTYTTLDEIRLRKESLLKEIQADDATMRKQWSSLFTKPDVLDKKATPARRINSLFNTSVGMIDAVILGWKLYRKYKK